MLDMILVAHARNEGWGSLVQHVGHERPFFAVKHVHLYTHAVTNMVVCIPSDQTVAHVSFFNEKKIYTHGRNMLSGRGLLLGKHLCALCLYPGCPHMCQGSTLWSQEATAVRLNICL
jgi:hypothetical protein